MLAEIFPICLKKYSTLYGNGNVDFYYDIIEYEKTGMDLDTTLKKIAGAFAIARTMDQDEFRKYIENPENNFTNRIKAGDMSLVHELSFFGVKKKNSTKPGRCFSAATKICTLWREALEYNHDCEYVSPAPFVIADSYLRDALTNINNTEPFTRFNIKSVYKDSEYENWRQIILDFKRHFNLNQFTEREIDKSLWVLWGEMLNASLLVCAPAIASNLARKMSCN